MSALSEVVDVRPEERRVAFLMAAYFFLVITSFWILKPIKKTLFIGFIADDGFEFLGSVLSAPQAELIAKVLNMFVAAAAVVVFSALSRRLRREKLTYVFTAAFIAAYAAYALLDPTRSSVGVWSFYLFGDLFSTLMVATFFAFLNDSVSSDQAKRLYGVVGFGGVAGGVFGATTVSVWIDELGLDAWLAIAAGIAVVIVLLARLASQDEAVAPPSPSAGRAAAAAVPEVPAPDDDAGHPAIAGARLVARSGYLFSIVAIVGLYELSSTVLDFQFTTAIVELSEDAAARDQNFATTYAVSNWLAMAVQLVLTSFVMRRFGLGVALLLLPATIALSSLGFFLAPTLVTGALLSISDNGLAYSINQSAKEALYVPTSAREKYEAKAFIDMFVQRFAKALGVGLGLVVGSVFAGVEGIAQLSLFLLPAVGLWAAAAVYAGRRFRAYEAAREGGDGR